MFPLTVHLIILAIASFVVSPLFRSIALKEVLAEAFFGLLRREHSFKLADSLPHLGLVRSVVKKSAAKHSAKVL